MATATDTKFSLTPDLDSRAAKTAARLEGIVELLNDKAIDPFDAEEQAKKVLGHLTNNIVAEVQAVASKTEMVAFARGLGVHVANQRTADPKKVAADVAARALQNYEDLADLKSMIDRRATAKRNRAEAVEDAAKALRWWAQDETVDDTHVWRRSTSDVTSVEQVLKYFGRVYCWFRGEDNGVFSDDDTERESLDVEAALRRLGNWALREVLTGDHTSENMMVQIRVGDLMGHMYRQIALRTVVLITHGSLDYDRDDSEIRVPFDDASEYLPRYRDREKLEAMVP